MDKKKIFTFVLLVIILLLGFTYSFASQEMLKDIENKVNDEANMIMNSTKNTVENAGRDISNSSKDFTNKIENSSENMMNDTKNAMKNNMNQSNDYTATRTSTEYNNSSYNDLMGNSLTFIIMVITAIAIFALISYYKLESSANHSKYND